MLAAEMAETEADTVEPAPGPLYEDISGANEDGDGILTTTNTSTTLATPADAAVQKVKKTKIVKRKRRPARPQQDPATFKVEPPAQTGTIFNMYVLLELSQTHKIPH